MQSRGRRRSAALAVLALLAAVAAPVPAGPSYTNFEVSHVHPIALTPDGTRLLVVNTPAARLEVFSVGAGGTLSPAGSIAVGLEPVTVTARTSTEAWVVNHLSDTVSVVNLSLGTVTRTIEVGDEPTDVAFAQGRAFVAVSGLDVVKVYSLANLDAAPTQLTLFADGVRALAVSPDGSRVYAVPLRSGNQTAIVNANIIKDNVSDLDTARLQALGLNDIGCAGVPPPYPPLPPGIARNPELTDPADGIPKVGLIVRWDAPTGQWRDDFGQSWNDCLPIRLPDLDLFAIDASTLAVTSTAHVGTSLFDVSVHPVSGKVYVANTEARNAVRFEHPLGVQGHVVDNRLTVVGTGPVTVTPLDLNTHIDRGSDPAANLAEREASLSQPGMLVWKSDGSAGYLTALGSRKVFRVDGACASGPCIFGADRSAPDAVVVGDGPSGVALLEGAARLYVLNRFSNRVAIVDTASLTKVGEVALPDPSPPVVKSGRRFLYDAVLTSGHGDASCSSCHLSGDLDGLAWDLGNPEGEFAPYALAGDNVRFVEGGLFAPTPCDPTDPDCATKTGFDPQKGPMTTQTLRGMLEPLHWRGDRATMNDFNQAFPGLMGTRDIGPIGGKPAGLTVEEMEQFRQFALAIQFPPNPLRRVDDTVPNVNVVFADRGFQGNPAAGENIYLNRINDGVFTCRGCHVLPFGAGGGKLGGVDPEDVTTVDAAPLFHGGNDKINHFDVKIPHLRNMYQKQGPTFGPPGGPAPDSKSGFGYAHDGSVPDLNTFFSLDVFLFTANNSAKQVRDISAFMLHFPTGTRPAVGRMITVPAGPPPTGTAAQESLLTTLVAVGDAADAGRHCELTAFALDGGRLRHSHLRGGAWTLDRASDAPRTLAALRQEADGPITFLCVTLDGGSRLGGDADLDAFLDGDDCLPGDPAIWAAPGPDQTVGFESPVRLLLGFDPDTGASTLFDLASGLLSVLRLDGGVEGAACLAGDVAGTTYDDLRVPPSGDGFYYLIRGANACGVGGYGTGREVLDSLSCP
jgi:YVTN family beta-propeller protein